MKNLIENLKENQQDFEFYPTTKEIVKAVYNDLAVRKRNGKRYSILDVGCGNGGFFTKFQEIRNEVQQYHINNNIDEDSYNFDENKNAKAIAKLGDEFAIEKSEILINNLPDCTVVVGTDFWENTLIDKQVDVIFSNPPYSEFEEWSAKIIKEAYSKSIYLVIPERWENSNQIKYALELRGFEAKILGSFDFLDAERAARAKVNLVKITAKKIKLRDQEYDGAIKDPFDSWFDEEFKMDKFDVEDADYWERNKKAEEEKSKMREKIENEVAEGRDLIQVLVGFYRSEMVELLENYKKVSALDPQLLKELGVKINDIKTGLKEKIKGTKYKYWKELFTNFKKINDRLTSETRSSLLGSLYNKTNIDFTEKNAYAIVIWVIKNANKYFDKQVVDMYKKLSAKENIKNYKSNAKVWESDNWRYNRDGNDHTHYCLDYRIVFSGGWSWSKDQLCDRTINLIDDIMIIGENLGFDGQSSKSFGWDKKPAYGEELSFEMRPNWRNDNTVKRLSFMKARFYKNGNVHLKFNQDFIKALNVEASRLLGWIRSPQEAAEEFPEDCKISENEAKKYFKGNFLLIGNPKQFLLN
jgi:SAM-dependent methyltransferase